MSEITIIKDDSQGPKDFSKGYLTFPFDGEEFKQFITGLLGKPQTITKIVPGAFEIHLKDLQNLFDLVNQRITQQNNGVLIQFTAKIYYTDESSVQLGSYDELITYNEVKPIVSHAVKLTWDYLLKFSDKKQAEKQVVEVLILSSVEPSTIKIDNLHRYLPDSGEIRIHIEHTARSWGSDIENMLTNQILSLLKKKNRFKSFIRKYNGIIGLVFAILFLLSSLIGAYLITNRFINTEIDKVKSFTNGSIKTTNEKIDFLTSYVASGISPQHYFKVGIFLLVSLILTIVFGIWISSIADNREPSFVILTRKALECKDEIMEKMKHKWQWFCFSIFISVVTSVLSNYIFKWLVE